MNTIRTTEYLQFCDQNVRMVAYQTAKPFQKLVLAFLQKNLIENGAMRPQIDRHTSLRRPQTDDNF